MTDLRAMDGLHVLLGMNTHINYDLPQALLAVINDCEFDSASLMAGWPPNLFGAHRPAR